MPARPVERKPDGEESDKSNGYCSCNFSESCVFVSVRASAQSKARVRTSKLASAVYPLNVMCGTSFVGTLVYPSVVAGCFALCLLPLVWLWLLEPFQVGNDDMASGAVHSGSGALLLLPAVGLMLNGTSSVLYGTIPEFVSPERRTRAFAVFYTGGSVAGATGPLLFGLFGDVVGLTTALIAVSCVALTTVPMVWALRPAFADD